MQQNLGRASHDHEPEQQNTAELIDGAKMLLLPLVRRVRRVAAESWVLAGVYSHLCVVNWINALARS